MGDLSLMFVSRYQLPTFPLPLFISGSEESISFSNNVSITPEDSRQSTVVPTYRESNYNKLDDRLFELDSIVDGIPREVVIQKNGSLKKNKVTATPNKTKGTNTSSEEFQDNEIINHLTDLMAQVDASLQAELAKIRNDDFDC